MIQSYPTKPVANVVLHSPPVQLTSDSTNAHFQVEQTKSYQLFHEIYQHLFLAELETQKRLRLQAIKSAWKQRNSAFHPLTNLVIDKYASSTPVRSVENGHVPYLADHPDPTDPTTSMLVSKLTQYMLDQHQETVYRSGAMDTGRIALFDPWTAVSGGEYSPKEVTPGMHHRQTGNTVFQTSPSISMRQTELESTIGLSDTHSSSPPDVSMDTANECIDLSLSSQRQRMTLSRCTKSNATSSSFSPKDCSHPQISNMSSYISPPPGVQSFQQPCQTHLDEIFHFVSPTNPLTDFPFPVLTSFHSPEEKDSVQRELSTTPSSAYASPESLPTNSSTPLTIRQERKSRKSGFQAGVTVGYTYDAFFVSDGRSRRRGKGKLRSKASNGIYIRRARNRSTSRLLGLSSSSSSSSGASSIHSTTSVLSEQPSWDLESVGKAPAQMNTSNSLLLATSLNPCSEHLSTPRYTCPDCGKSYATSSNLSRHKQTHRSLDSQSARKCPHCGKAYVSMPALSMHILTHDLRHRCDLCGKAFSRPWLLQGHRRAHTGEKPYGCAHCGRAFADRSNLRAHMQTHSGMKQYECHFCHKNFALKAYLSKHLESGCPEMKSSPSDVITQNEAVAWSVSTLISDDRALKLA